MSRHWGEIRRLAREWRAELMPRIGDSLSADVALGAALEASQLKAVPLPPDHPLLAGAEAVLDVEMRRIWYSNAADPETARLLIAHELGHFRQHDGRSACGIGQIAAEPNDDPLPLGLAQVEGYGPDERREHEANVFAQEFLLPSDAVRRWFIDEGLRASAISARVGVSEPMVRHHLAYAVLVSDLLPSSPTRAEQDGDESLPPDPSQISAASADGPVLVVAGPGTGKTRTLVHRVLHLLERGTEPAAILALTFSNKAAEEMRQRIARAAPDAARVMWIGTFHAFGLEILRKYGTRIGLPEKPAVLAVIDTLLLLEEDLLRLRLDRYLNLWEPTMYLRDIVGAISRAKDELVTPERYRELAEGMAAAATTAAATSDVEAALEVARVYAHYQQRLRELGAVDFGDLIARAVEVLRHQDGVAKNNLRAAFAHILVDEFQDVNHGCAMLLKEVAGDGSGLWAVGDVRQSIYRFRGAAPRNVREFETTYANARVIPLRRNYRAQQAIVSTYAALAPRMKAAAGQPFTSWDVHRPDDDPEVLVRVAETGDAEGDGIAREIQRLATRAPSPIPYREQAVLCRSHRTLERIASRLERAGVPVLYLGDLFERPEVRDLLSLLALACEGDGRALVRLARLPSYEIPLTDVQTLFRVARERDVAFPRALALASDSEITLSSTGAAGLARLRHDVDELCFGTTAWGMLSRYLFEASDYLALLLQDGSLHARQQRLALFQFLQFAHEQGDAARLSSGPRPATNAKKAFLRFVRKLSLYADDRQLRQVPEWAADLDAVRLMTVHASKGLEFRAVFVPYLGNAYFPQPRRGRPCPPPAGLVPAAEIDTHEEEEECLFFVALSRARDVLCLSRAEQYGAVSSKASRLFELVADALPNSPCGPVAWPASVELPAVAVGGGPLAEVEEFDGGALDAYKKCPRSFFYEHVLGLSGRREESAYVLFHRCVYDVLRWMRDERREGRRADQVGALRRLAEAWERMGPRQHPYEALYREAASRLVDGALQHDAEINSDVSQPTWVVALPHGRVRVTPDEVELIRGPTTSTIVRVLRHRTGRPTASERKRDLYGLYYRGAQQQHPGASMQLETLYLGTSTLETVTLTPKTAQTRLNHYDEALMKIHAGEFPPTPDDHECPRCPHYFICPAAEDGVAIVPTPRKKPTVTG